MLTLKVKGAAFSVLKNWEIFMNRDVRCLAESSSSHLLYTGKTHFNVTKSNLTKIMYICGEDLNSFINLTD